MTIYKQLLFVGAVVAFSGGLVAKNKPIPIRYEALQHRVQQYNGYVKRDRYAVDAAIAKTGFLQRARSPEVLASVGGDAFQTGGLEGMRIQPVGRLEARLSLYNGGQETFEEVTRQSYVGFLRLQLSQTIAEQVAMVQDLYWDIVAGDERLRYLQVLQVHHAEGYASAQRRYKRGLISQSDVMAFELYRSRLDEDIESIQHEKKVLLIKFKSVLGISESAVLTLSHAVLPHEHEALLKASLQTSQTTVVQALGVEAEMATLNLSKLVEKAQPSVDLFGAYTLHTQGERAFSGLLDRGDMAVGLRATVVVYDGNRLQSDIASARMTAQAVSAEAAYTAQVMAAKLKSLQEELIHLHDLFHSSESRLSQAKQFLQTMVHEYDRGVKGATDVIAAMQLYEDLQTNYVGQKQQYQQTKSALLAKFVP